MNKKVLLIPIIIILFCFDILALSYVNGEKIKNDAKNWLKTFNVEENLSILPEIKYPVCDKIEFTNISMNYSLIKAQCFSPNEWSLILRNKLKKENNSFNVKKSIEKRVWFNTGHGHLGWTLSAYTSKSVVNSFITE